MVVELELVVVAGTRWFLHPSGLAAPQHPARIDTRLLASPIPSDSLPGSSVPSGCLHRYRRVPTKAIRAVAPPPPIATTAAEAIISRGPAAARANYFGEFHAESPGNWSVDVASWPIYAPFSPGVSTLFEVFFIGRRLYLDSNRLPWISLRL